MASRYSVDQSSSVAGLTRLSTACVALSPRISQPASISISTSGLRMCRRRGAVDQQSLGRAAHAGAPHLGVEHDLLGHLQRGRLVHIDVADAFQVREHRHARFRLHARDQALAAARNDDVDIAVEPGRASARPRRGRGSAPAGSRPRAGRPRASPWPSAATMARLVRRLSEPPRRIAALPDFRHSAPASAVTFGPALVDDADDAERHPHPLDGHAVRPGPGFGNDADGILERAHGVDGGGDRLHPRGVERQAGRERRRSRPAPRASAISSALAAKMRDYLPRTAAAMRSRARSFWAVGASASARAASLAWRPISRHAGGNIAQSLQCFSAAHSWRKARQTPFRLVPITSALPGAR